MNRKIVAFIAGIALVSVAITAVTASSWVNTPLYTVRMEQVSNNMHFLPTEVNDFTYTAENGCNVTYDVSAYCDANASGIDVQTYSGGDTCWLYYTCPFTCINNITCYWTCKPTACAPCPFK